MGYECPKDVSVVGFGDEPWCEFTAPPLTTLKQDTEANEPRPPPTGCWRAFRATTPRRRKSACPCC